MNHEEDAFVSVCDIIQHGLNKKSVCVYIYI